MEQKHTEPWVSFWDLSYRDGSYLEYWDPPKVDSDLRRFADELAERGARRLLDLGCGAGFEALYLASRGFTVVGIDSSSEALKRARKAERISEEPIDIEWHLGNVLELPLESHAFDAVLDRGCFHCVDHDNRRSYAREVARVLAPSGILWIRSARESDDEEGVVGIRPAELERLFPASEFEQGPLRPHRLVSRCGSLEAVSVRIRKRRASETQPGQGATTTSG